MISVADWRIEDRAKRGEMDEKVPTIIDNAGENTVLGALMQILPEAVQLDIATGYFEISSLLALGEAWREIERIRLIMGDETSRRTRQLLVEALTKITDESIESYKEHDDTLTGLEAVIVDIEHQGSILQARPR